MNIEINNILAYEINFNFITRLTPFVAVITECLKFATLKQTANNSFIMTLPYIIATRKYHILSLSTFDFTSTFLLLATVHIVFLMLPTIFCNKTILVKTEAYLFRSFILSPEMSRYLLLQ